MARMKVIVVGGGIGGITCMLALRQRGVDAQLFEQAAAFGQVGAGIQVSSNAARILLKLGLGPALKKVATYPEARDYRGWDTGERLYYTQLGQKAEAHFGSPYYAAHRAELLDILLSELDECEVRLGSRVECVDQDDRGVTLTLADGTTAQGGTNAQGTVFRMTTNGALTTLIAFNSTNGANPYASLVQGADGSLYGTTGNGGDQGLGTVYRVSFASPSLPIVQTISQDGGLVVLGWNATVGQNYRVQYKTNLSDLGWIDWITNLTATNSTMTLLQNVGVGPQRFYRVGLVP